MKKISTVISALLLISMLCASCSPAGGKTVKIAVMGERDKFHTDYEAGIAQAIEDLNDDYAGKGFSFEYEIYDDGGSYDTGAQIVDELVQDNSVTAVIGSLDMDINVTAAYMFDNSKKLFVVPYALYDSVYTNNFYETVLSLATSGSEIGKCLAKAVARETNAKRWAVCSADDEFSMSEMRGFMHQNKQNGGVQIVDCNDIVKLMSDFENETNRWKLLGVEGVAIFPGKAYETDALFELLKNLRAKLPDAVYMGDSHFDNSEAISADPELKKAMTGFISVSDFISDSDTENDDEYMAMAEKFYEKHGRDMDTWYMQAYNMTRMIGDTAFRQDTTDGKRIADALYNNGYDGIGQKFAFAFGGFQINDVMQYYVMDENGAAREITVK